MMLQLFGKTSNAPLKRWLNPYWWPLFRVDWQSGGLLYRNKPKWSLGYKNLRRYIKTGSIL